MKTLLERDLHDPIEQSEQIKKLREMLDRYREKCRDIVRHKLQSEISAEEAGALRAAIRDVGYNLGNAIDQGSLDSLLNEIDLSRKV